MTSEGAAEAAGAEGVTGAGMAVGAGDVIGAGEPLEADVLGAFGAELPADTRHPATDDMNPTVRTAAEAIVSGVLWLTGPLLAGPCDG